MIAAAAAVRMRALAVGLAIFGVLGGCTSLVQEDPRHEEMKQKGLGSMMGLPAGPYGRAAPGFGSGGLMGPGLSMVRPSLRGGTNLTREQVGAYFLDHLARRGDARLRLGPVRDKDSNTISVDIVTAHGVLIFRYQVDRHTGIARRVQ